MIKEINRCIDIVSLLTVCGAKNIYANSSKVRSECLIHGGVNPNVDWSFRDGRWVWCCHSKCGGEGGDLISFIQKLNGCDFLESIKWLASFAGVTIENDTEPIIRKPSSMSFISTIKRIKEQKQTKKYKVLNDSLLNEFYGTIHRDLREEGFDEEIVDRFELGFCTEGELKNRITIPIRDHNGKLVAISGRATGGIEPRYKVMDGNMKGSVLYNLDKAKDYIKASREMVIVEGFKDVWRLYQHNKLNVVALMGCNYTEAQLKLIVKYGWDVKICLDGDNAGRVGNEKLVKAIRKYHDVWVIDLPDGKDPADLLKEEFWYYYSQARRV